MEAYQFNLQQFVKELTLNKIEHRSPESMAVLRNSITIALSEISDLKDKLNIIQSLSLEKTRIVEKLENRLFHCEQQKYNRNMQIKDLKAKLLEHNHFVCSHCPELANNPKREGNFGCLGCKYFINR